jgi:hypothetical protein
MEEYGKILTGEGPHMIAAHLSKVLDNHSGLRYRARVRMFLLLCWQVPFIRSSFAITFKNRDQMPAYPA